MQALLRFPSRDRPKSDQPSSPPVLDLPPTEDFVATLIQQAQHGDLIAFERLMACYQTKILGYARAFVSDAEQANDVAQDAMLRIYRSLGGFRFQSSPKTWMFRIVRNIVLDYAKSRRSKERKREQSIDHTPDSEMSACSECNPEAQVLANERKEQLWQALSQVPESFRSVLLFCDLQGMSYDEVAAILNIPVGTVKSRLNRGREFLREVLLKQGAFSNSQTVEGKKT